MGKIKQKMALKRVEAELAIVQVAIESYKAKYGHYPPDNPNNFTKNQLFYELVGCRVTLDPVTPGNTSFAPLDGAPPVTVSAFNGYFGAGVASIINSGSGVAGDEGGGVKQFLRDIKPAQYADTVGNIRVLGVKVDGPGSYMIGDLNPYCYNSSSPTNNKDSFDLWVDVMFGKKTNRVNNWRSTPIINP